MGHTSDLFKISHRIRRQACGATTRGSGGAEASATERRIASEQSSRCSRSLPSPNPTRKPVLHLDSRHRRMPDLAHFAMTVQIVKSFQLHAFLSPACRVDSDSQVLGVGKLLSMARADQRYAQSGFGARRAPRLTLRSPRCRTPCFARPDRETTCAQHGGACGRATTDRYQAEALAPEALLRQGPSDRGSDSATMKAAARPCRNFRADRVLSGSSASRIGDCAEKP